VSRWTVALYDPADMPLPATPIAEPTLVTLPTCMVEHNEIGDGSITVQLSDADAALLDVDQLLIFSLDGTPIHSVFVEGPLEYTTVGPAGEKRVTLYGKGGLSVLGDALVEPATGIGHLPVEEVRPFNYTAVDYDDSGIDWVAATEYATVTEETTFWTGLPQDYPDYGEPDGTSVPKWIGPSTGDETDAPEGACYYRRTITTDAILFDLFMAADNYGEAYLDGVLILTTNGFGITRHIEGGMQISAGDHVLAFKTVNFFDDGAPGGNPTGIIYSACSLTQDGLIGEVLTFSGSLTLINEYPASPPGVTVGKSQQVVIYENKAATPARLVGLSFDFTDVEDSNGETWDELPDISCRTGDDMLTFLRQLIDSRYCDARITPDLILQLYKPDTLGSTTSVTPNLLNVKRRKVSAPVTSALIKWRDTFTEYDSGETPVKRRFLRLEQAPSAESAIEIGTAVVDARKMPLVAVSAEIDAGIGPNANEPFTGFFPGDTIPIDGTDELIQAITFTCDDAGNPRWRLDIKDRILEAEERVARLQKRMLGGTLGGLSNTPSLLTQQGTRQGSQYKLDLVTFTYTGDNLDSPEKQVDRTADLFWLKMRLDEVWPDDVTIVLRINNHDTPHALECTVPAGDQLAIVWLAVGTTTVTTTDWYMLGLTEPAAPPRLTATVAWR
jgi:hypothetical protein